LLSPLAMRTFVKYCGMEQLVARRAHNPKVTGSSPVPATTNPLYSTYLGFSFFWDSLETTFSGFHPISTIFTFHAAYPI